MGKTTYAVKVFPAVGIFIVHKQILSKQLQAKY